MITLGLMCVYVARLRCGIVQGVPIVPRGPNRQMGPAACCGPDCADISDNLTAHRAIAVLESWQALVQGWRLQLLFFWHA